MEPPGTLRFPAPRPTLTGWDSEDAAVGMVELRGIEPISANLTVIEYVSQRFGLQGSVSRRFPQSQGDFVPIFKALAQRQAGIDRCANQMQHQVCFPPKGA